MQMKTTYVVSAPLASLCLLAMAALGDQYYVATDGNDANPGSMAQPWRTIQKAANTLVAGDTVIVRVGTYPERITTVRGGTNESSRIIFEAEGQVTMRGWVVNHAYITLNGFDITGHSGTSTDAAYVKVGTGGNNLELLSCKIRDGISIKTDDMVFIAPNLISNNAGGFAAAGFVAGNTIAVSRATNVTLLNTSSYVIASVTDTVISITGANIVDDGPKPAYVSGGNSYALHFAGNTQNAVIRSNLFNNLSYRYCFVAGSNHLFESNTFTTNNGWDLIFFVGTNHVFRGNLFLNNGWGAFHPSAELFDNWPTRYENIHFTNNFVESMIGVIDAQKLNATVSGPLFVTRNVFVDISLLSVVMPNTTIENNTFLRVAKQNNAAVALARHAVFVSANNYATNAVIRNNIFVDCGQRTYPYTESEMGWYQVSGPTNSVGAEGNFVAGGPPGFGTKLGWPEGNPLLNGGDPGFVNINDPLGPDGLPFTDDDGLRPLPTSKLVGTGANGLTIGAYALPGGGQPMLVADMDAANQLHLEWPQTVETWTLQSAPAVSGSWSNVSPAPSLENGQFRMTVGTTNPAAFYRLIR